MARSIKREKLSLMFIIVFINIQLQSVPLSEIQSTEESGVSVRTIRFRIIQEQTAMKKYLPALIRRDKERRGD